MARRRKEAVKDWGQVMSFLALGRTRNLREAARQLGTTATTVRRHVDNLGDALGTRLLREAEGTSREIHLTDEGRALYDYLAPKGIDQALSAAWHEATSHVLKPTLRVAATGVSLQRYLPQALSLWMATHPYPKHRVEIIRCDHDKVREHVLEGAADAGLGRYDPTDHRLQQWPYAGSRFVIAYRLKTPISGELGVQDLDELLHWVLPSKSNLVEEQLLRDVLGREPKIMIRAPNFIDTMLLVRELGCATLCSEHFVSLFSDWGLTTMPLPTTPALEGRSAYSGAVLWQGQQDIREVEPPWKRAFLEALQKTITSPHKPSA